MKYAICNETFGDWPLEKALAFARQHGYTGWEVAPFMLADELDSLTAKARADYRATVEDAGLQLIGLHWLLAKTKGLHLTTANTETRQRTADYLRALARLCNDLGGETMVLGSPQQRNVAPGQSMLSAMDHAAEVLTAVVPELEQNNVRIAVEPLGKEEGNFLNTAAEARTLIEMVGSPQVQLHLDVKAMSDEPTPISQIIRDHADSMIHFHANDPNRQGPGMGDVEFKPIFQTLNEIGYDGWVSVEVFDYSPGIEQLVSQSMANMIAAQG